MIKKLLLKKEVKNMKNIVVTAIICSIIWISWLSYFAYKNRNTDPSVDTRFELNHVEVKGVVKAILKTKDSTILYIKDSFGIVKSYPINFLDSSCVDIGQDIKIIDVSIKEKK